MSRRLKIPVVIVGALLLLYTIAGFLVIPHVARSQAIDYLHHNYGADLSIEKIRFNPFNLVAGIDDLVLHARDGERLLAFEQLVVNLQWRSLFERAIVFRDIELMTPFIHVRLAEDGTLNLVEAFTVADSRASSPEPATGPEDTSAGPPALVIESFLLSGGELRFTDDRDGRDFDHRLTPLDLQLLGFTTRPQQEKADLARFLINLAEEGRIEMTGGLSTAPAALDIRVIASELPLSIFQPYVPETLAADINDGRLSFTFDIRHGQTGQETLLSLDGAAAIDGFVVDIRGSDEPVLLWDRIALDGIALDLQPDALVIDEISIDGLDSSFRIYDDGETNIGKVLRTATATENGDGTGTAEAAEEEPETAAFPFTIRRIVVDGSTLLYRDDLIRPPVTVRIDGLGGNLDDLGSSPETRTTASIQGTVGGHGRAEIGGDARLFAPAPDLDATVSFENIELTDFSPYSGRFAGYEIVQGKLFLDLHYTLDGTRLKGDNDALFDQFELGDRVDSEDAPRLPLKLALSLLRDREGRIEITLPVEGDIDDPEFRFGHLVWQALLNTLTKIATAPFSFIADVFGGGPDMEYAQFDAGSAILRESEQEKFQPLSTALVERPRLAVEIQGMADPRDDRNRLREDKLESLLAAAPTLEAAYDGHFGEGAAAALNDEIASRAEEAEEGAGTESGEMDLPDPGLLLETELRERLLAAQVISDEELISLAHARGRQVMDVLVQDGEITPERIFVRRGELTHPGEGTRARLILEAR